LTGLQDLRDFKKSGRSCYAVKKQSCLILDQLFGIAPNSTQTSRNQTGKYDPPNFTEVTECRRIKFFLANLGVFGVYRRVDFALVAFK